MAEGIVMALFLVLGLVLGYRGVRRRSAKQFDGPEVHVQQGKLADSPEQRRHLNGLWARMSTAQKTRATRLLADRAKQFRRKGGRDGALD